jgi:hypothetical protein
MLPQRTCRNTKLLILYFHLYTYNAPERNEAQMLEIAGTI